MLPLQNSPSIRIGFENALDGPIPTEIGLLSSLRIWYFYDNKIKGTIPTEIGLLSRLTVLYVCLYWNFTCFRALQNNNFTGSIPTELGTMNIEALYS